MRLRAKGRGAAKRGFVAYAAVRGAFPLHYFISASRLGGMSTARCAVVPQTRALSGIWHRLRAIRHCGLAQAASQRTVSRSKRLPREHQTALVNHPHAHVLAALFYTDWTIYSAEGIGDHVSASV